MSPRLWSVLLAFALLVGVAALASELGGPLAPDGLPVPWRPERGAGPPRPPLPKGAVERAAGLEAAPGVAPPLVSVGDAWQPYRNGALGLAVRYPPGWKLVEEPQQSGLTLYPPDVDPDTPGPTIAFTFAPQRAYLAESLVQPNQSQPQPITVAGVAGRQYEDTAAAVPGHGYYVELPHRGGTLRITATQGPAVNLVPQLEELLKTVVLQP